MVGMELIFYCGGVLDFNDVNLLLWSFFMDFVSMLESMDGVLY